MRRKCDVCGEPYLYSPKDPVTIDFDPPACSKDCFKSLLHRSIVLAQPLNPNTKEWDNQREQMRCKPKTVRNAFELLVYLSLRDLGFEAYYEPMLYRFNKIKYLPDFMICEKPYAGQIFIEAKGIWAAGAHLKVRAFSENELAPRGSFIWVIDNDIYRRVLRGKS